MKIVNDQMHQSNRIIDAMLLLGRVLKSQCVIVITLIKSLKALYFVSKHLFFFFFGGGEGCEMKRSQLIDDFTLAS